MTDTPTPAPKPDPTPPKPDVDPTKFKPEFLQHLWELLKLDVDVRFERRCITLMLPLNPTDDARDLTFEVRRQWTQAGLPVEYRKRKPPGSGLPWPTLMEMKVADALEIDELDDSVLESLKSASDAKISVTVPDRADMSEGGEAGGPS